jgi:hypothetical protein
MRPTSPAGFGPDKERVLWVNVVLRAILDGTADQTDSRTDRDRREARAWFRLNNPDFVEVCNLAGLDPAATLEKARSVFERHDHAKANGEPFKLASPAKPAKAPIAPTLYSAHGLTMSLFEWSRHLDIAPDTLIGRLKIHPPEIALSKDFKRAPRGSGLTRSPYGKKAKLYTVNGVSKTLSDWAVSSGISYRTLSVRLRKGYTMEAAIAVSRSFRKDTNLHTIDGEAKTLRQWADVAGITYDVLIARMRKGRSLAEALAMPNGRWSRGAGSNLKAFEGTGAGSTAQETPDIDFSGLDPK